MDRFRARIENFIYDAWKAFSHKAGNEVIPVNNEASMQLNYAYLLRKHIDFIIYDKKEKIDIELGYTQMIKKQNKTVDMLLRTSNGKETLHVPMVLKCCCQSSSSGGKSNDSFKKEVYAGLELLEQYAALPHFVQGYAFLITDVRTWVYPPENKPAKHGDYSIAQGYEIKEGIPIKNADGSQKLGITLKKSYRFEWHQHGKLWFSLLQGI